MSLPVLETPPTRWWPFSEPAKKNTKAKSASAKAAKKPAKKRK